MTENAKKEQLLKKLWDDYGQYLKKLCTFKLSSAPHLIDDCVQDVFLDLNAALNEEVKINNYKAWLTKVANNKIVDIYKDLKKQADNIVPLTYELAQSIADSSEEMTFEENLSEEELLIAKESFISSLSEEKKTLFYQRFVLRKKSEELALIFNTTSGNIRKRVFRLRHKARCFAKEYLKEQNAQK